MSERGQSIFLPQQPGLLLADVINRVGVADPGNRPEVFEVFITPRDIVQCIDAHREPPRERTTLLRRNRNRVPGLRSNGNLAPLDAHNSWLDQVQITFDV